MRLVIRVPCIAVVGYKVHTVCELEQQFARATLAPGGLLNALVIS
jgi:hypothetical protein